MPQPTNPRVKAVILAAGGSRRFGATKQLHQYRGEPLIKRAVNATTEAGVTEIVVVLGAESHAIEKELEKVPNVRTTVNPNWQAGLASSIRSGLAAISNADGVLITLSDQPLVDSKAIKKLIERFDDTHRIIASKYADTVGVPAIFGNEYIGELKQLTGDHGAGKWIKSRIADVTIVHLEEAAIDIDTPADAARLEEL